MVLCMTSVLTELVIYYGNEAKYRRLLLLTTEKKMPSEIYKMKTLPGQRKDNLVLGDGECGVFLAHDPSTQTLGRPCQP